MKFFIKTYGCQMNERDSEVVENMLEQAGHAPVLRESEADLIIVNTCSVREKAEDKAIGKLRLLVARSRRPRLVCAMGCMVQRMGADVFKLVPGLHMAVGSQAYTRIPALIQNFAPEQLPALVLEADSERMAEPFGHSQGKISAFVNILFGCSRGCSYCIVPRVRGPEWSRSATSVLKEVRALAATGVREIVLLGQSVMAYGVRPPAPEDLPDSRLGLQEPFPRLIEAVASVSGIARVRFTSGHPSGCTEELARVMAAMPVVCPHLHLPLQSGSDRILELMNRGYSRAEYIEAAQRIRKIVPSLVLSTDVIVGFPSETEADFELTRALMNEIGFDNAFVFQFSPRPGTRAAQMTDDVPASDKLRRTHILLEDQNKRSREFCETFIGRDVEVLAEGPSRRDSRRWAGRTSWNRLVVFTAPPGLVSGEIARVRVDRATPQTLGGSVLSTQPCPAHIGA